MKRKVRLVSMLALTALAVATVGLAGASARPAADAAASSTLIVNLGLPPTTLDPAVTCSLTEFGIAGSFYARLTQYGTKAGPAGTRQANVGKIVPWLARSWTVSRGGRTYTFKLRSGMRFPSGRPVDANAFKYSIQRVVKMNQCGNSVIQETQFNPPLIKSIQTPNRTTLVVNYSRPNPNAPQDLAQPAAGVVDASVVSRQGGVKKNAVNEWMAGHTAGYGPFLLEKYEPGKQIVLRANENFIQPPASDRIIVNLVTSDPTLLLQARSGAADVSLFLSKQAVNSLKGNSCCNLIVNDLPMAQYLNLPQKVPALKNRKFREALTYAVPYQQILDNIAFGYGKLYYGEWMPAMPWFKASIGRPRAFDLDKAKRLITESGVQTPVSFPLLIPEGDATQRQIATAIAGVWSQIGVQATVRQVSPTEHINVVYSTKNAPTMYYDGPGVVAPDYLWAYDGVCGNAFNNLLVCIRQADRLMKQIPFTTNKAKRQRILDQVQRLWIAQSPRINVYQDRFVAVVNNRVKTYFFDRELDMRRWRK